SGVGGGCKRDESTTTLSPPRSLSFVLRFASFTHVKAGRAVKQHRAIGATARPDCRADCSRIDALERGPACDVTPRWVSQFFSPPWSRSPRSTRWHSAPRAAPPRERLR